MAEIIKFVPANAAKDPDVVLEQAKGQYNDVLVIGWDKDDELDVRASLDLKAKDILWLIERFKLNLLNGEYQE